MESTAAAWQSDPLGRHEHRYWDGETWTEHVSDSGRTGVDRVASSDGIAPPPPLVAPRGPTVYVVQSRTNGLAIASMVLGIVWIYWIGSVLAIIFGHVALSQIKKSGEMQRGRGMAIAGLVLGYVGVALLVLVVIVASANSGSSSS